MAYLFDTDAVSEVLKRRPALAYVRWLRTVSRGDQFTSAVVVGELYKGAFRSAHTTRHLQNIEGLVLPAMTVLPYDVGVARVFGEIQARLETEGEVMADADPKPAVASMKASVRVYPLAECENPPKQKFLNLSGREFNTIHANDFSFFEEIDQVIREEPSDALDPEVLGPLASIGIEKGQPFAPPSQIPPRDRSGSDSGQTQFKLSFVGRLQSRYTRRWISISAPRDGAAGGSAPSRQGGRR